MSARVELAEDAPVVADGFVVVSSKDDHAVCLKVQSLAERFGLVWSASHSKTRTVDVLGLRDGTVWVGMLVYSFGPPVALPPAPEDADLPAWQRSQRERFERTVTVRAGWVRPGDYVEWCRWVEARWEPRLAGELAVMSAEHRAQWAVPVTGKGETVAAFKKARDMRTGVNGGRGGKATARRDGHFRFTYRGDGRPELVGRMRDLGARVAFRVDHAPGAGCEGPTLSRVEYEPYTPVESAPVKRSPRKVPAPAPAAVPAAAPASYAAVVDMLAELAETASPREASHLLAAVDALLAAESERMGVAS